MITDLGKRANKVTSNTDLTVAEQEEKLRELVEEAEEQGDDLAKEEVEDMFEMIEHHYRHGENQG